MEMGVAETKTQIRKDGGKGKGNMESIIMYMRVYIEEMRIGKEGNY